MAPPQDPRRQAFKQNYESVVAALLVWVRLQVQPHATGSVDPDDVIQEVWCRAYTGFGGFDPGRGSFRAWVFGIAGNVLLEEFRRLSRTPRGLQADIGGAPDVGRSHQPEEQLVAEITSISERAARNETVLRLLERASTLPEDERQLLMCRGLEGQSYAEVSCRLGITAEAARSRWRRLREQLRASIGEVGLWMDEGHESC